MATSSAPFFPRKIGPYRIDEPVGAGGMGRVYRAYHELLDRPVALKKIHSEQAADEVARERFLREARATARLNHPAIAQIYDVLIEDDGDWIVMELVEGSTLAELTRFEPLSWQRALPLARQIAEGLEAAHQVGIVHRDLKTENVIVAPAERVKILDFGIAKQLWSSSTSKREDVNISQVGQILGTPRSMSPEQAMGRKVDHRSDLFSLGVLLYEILTRVSPFDGPGTFETVSRICAQPHLPIQQHVADLPAGLPELIDSLLQKEPGARPASAGEVAATLATLSAPAPSATFGGMSAATGWSGTHQTVASRPLGQAGDVQKIRTLLMTDLVGSTELVSRLGDRRAAEINALHDHMARELLQEHDGLEIDKSDGFLLLFYRPIEAVRYALDYHSRLAEISRLEDVPLKARAGIHLGEVYLRTNPPSAVARGAKPVEVEGLAKSITARVMGLARGAQTLLTRAAFDFAHRGAADLAEEEAPQWLRYDSYQVQGVDEPLQICEVGMTGIAPLQAPQDSDKAVRVEGGAGRNPGSGMRSGVFPRRSTPTTGRESLTLGRAGSTGERRQMTVLCCELDPGDTDAEDLYEMMPAIHDTARRELEHFGGTLGNALGNLLVGYFGYPMAHEDDAERAVRAALRLAGEIARLGEQLGGELVPRIAVHTGPALVLPHLDQEMPLALGKTLDLATAIPKNLGPRDVAVSAITERLTSDAFLTEALEPVHLPGAEAPQAIYRVLSAREPRERTAAIDEPQPLVAREHELETLLRCWQQAADGRGQVVQLCGEAGIGKSRLLLSLEEHLASDQIRRLTVSGSPYGQNSPFHPILELLRQLLELAPETDTGEQLDRLEKLLETLGLPLPETVPLVATLLSLPYEERHPALALTPQKEREQTLEVVAALIFELAEQMPTLLVIEDLHWVDPSTFDLLGQLVEQVDAVPLLLVLTYRPHVHPPWSQPGHLTQLNLARLGRDAAATVIDHVTEGMAIPAEVREHILEKTDGVPLFVEELTRTILESGVLEERDGRYELTRSLAGLAVPDTLRDSLTARLDRLETAKSVAQLAAALGREFPHELIAAVSALDDRDLRSELDRLVKADILQRKGFATRARYFFRHALIRDAAYDSLLKKDRKRLHGRIAETLAERFASVREARPELLAEHYSRAGLARPASDYWLEAGDRAATRCANSEAIEHLRAGLEQTGKWPAGEERDRRELSLQTALGQAVSLTRGYGAPDVQKAYDRAHALCRDLGETPELFRTLLGLWHFYVVRAELETARDLGRQLLHLSGDDGAQQATAHFALGSALFYAGELAEAREHLEESLRVEEDGASVRLAAEENQISARSCLSLVLWQLGFADQALEVGRAAIDRARALEHLPSLAYALNFAANLHASCGQVSACRERARELHKLSEELGFFWLVSSNALLGWAEAVAPREGDETLAGQGIERMREALTSYLGLGCRLGQTQILSRLAEGLLARGATEDGLQVIGEALAAARETGERYWEAELHRLHGELIAAARADRAGDAGSQAEESFQTALALARRQEARSLELRAALSLSRRSANASDRETRQILQAIYASFTEGFGVDDLQQARLELEKEEVP